VNVTVENLAPCKKLLRFEVEAEVVDETFETMTKDFSRKVSLPGFRAGKAPRDMVEKQFGKDIENEVKRKLMTESYRQGIKDQKVNVLGQPDVEEIQFGKGQAFQFAVTVETSPEFELPEYRGLRAQREGKRVTDEDVAEAIEALRNPKADFVKVDRPLQAGDIAVVNYEGTSDGKPLTELAPTAQGLTQKQGFWVEIRPDSFLAGFTEKLVGAGAGEKRTVEVDFPAEFVTPQLSGKHAVYEVEVTEVRERVLPPLDDAFAKTFDAANMEELREGVRRDLQNELNTRQRRLIRGQLVKALLNAVNFDLPESSVDQETRSVVYEIVSENQKRGVPKEMIDRSKEEIYGAASQVARERVKTSFLFQRIADVEGIRATESEISARVTAMAKSYNMAPAAFVKELEKRNGLSDIYQQVIHEKVLDLLQQFAKVEDAPVAGPSESPAGEGAGGS
jgi:trigger factor